MTIEVLEKYLESVIEELNNTINRLKDQITTLSKEKMCYHKNAELEKCTKKRLKHELKAKINRH